MSTQIKLACKAECITRMPALRRTPSSVVYVFKYALSLSISNEWLVGNFCLAARLQLADTRIRRYFGPDPTNPAKVSHPSVCVCGSVSVSVSVFVSELWMNSSILGNSNPIWDSLWLPWRATASPLSYCKLHKLPKIASHVPLKVFGFWPGSVLPLQLLLFRQLATACQFLTLHTFSPSVASLA